jgi:hypothetical protein
MTDLPVQSPTPGIGAFAGVNRRLDVPAPAAGAEWSLTLPGGSWWRLLLGRATLVTDATVTTRVPGLQLLDPDAQVYETLSQTGVTATNTAAAVYASGAGAVNIGQGSAEAPVSWPDVVMPAGWVLRSRTLNLQAADQYSAIRLWFAEIDLGPGGAILGRPDEYLPNLIGPEGP